MDPGFVDKVFEIASNNGVGILCVLYWIFRDYKYTQNLMNAFAELNAAIKSLEQVNSKIVSENERSRQNDF